MTDWRGSRSLQFDGDAIELATLSIEADAPEQPRISRPVVTGNPMRVLESCRNNTADEDELTIS